MEESARYLMFHAVIMLLAGLLAGIPYGKAILGKANQRLKGQGNSKVQGSRKE